MCTHKGKAKRIWDRGANRRQTELEGRQKWGEEKRQNRDQVYDKTYVLIVSFPLQEMEIHDSIAQ